MMDWFMNAEAHDADYEELMELMEALAEEEEEIPALRGVSEEDLADAASWALAQEEQWLMEHGWEEEE